MKKTNFLDTIQQEACFPGSRAAVAWETAVNADEKDPRWQAVRGEAMDLILNGFASAFGVKLPAPPVRKPRMTEVERLERQIARIKENLVGVTNPDWIAAAKEDIAALEKKLQRAREEEEE